MVGMLDPPITQEILFDGITDIAVTENIFRCTLFAKHKVAGKDRRVEVGRLAVPIAELPDVIQQTMTAWTAASRNMPRPKDGH